jgi:tyrosyl-tRNA synthetase
MAAILGRGPVCRSCLFASAKTAKTAKTHAPVQRRSISQGHIRKTQEAEEAWAQQAQDIQDGKQPNLWDIFEERGFVKDTAGYDSLRYPQPSRYKATFLTDIL